MSILSRCFHVVGLKLVTILISIAFTNNIDYMSEAQLEAAVRAIAQAHPDLILKVIKT